MKHIFRNFLNRIFLIKYLIALQVGSVESYKVLITTLISLSLYIKNYKIVYIQKKVKV